MNMLLGIASLGWEGWSDCVQSWFKTSSRIHSSYICAGLKVVPAMQRIYELSTEEILGFIHDDTIVHDADWDVRVLQEFQDESVGLVSFTGAIGHGRPELYRVPYHLPDLARQNFFSNMRDAENHG